MPVITRSQARLINQKLTPEPEIVPEPYFPPEIKLEIEEQEIEGKSTTITEERPIIDNYVSYVDHDDIDKIVDIFEKFFIIKIEEGKKGLVCLENRGNFIKKNYVYDLSTNLETIKEKLKNMKPENLVGRHIGYWIDNKYFPFEE